jgi:hypothetical protein
VSGAKGFCMVPYKYPKHTARLGLSVLNARFLLAILVEEKTSFFATALFSHNTPRSHSIEER